MYATRVSFHLPFSQFWPFGDQLAAATAFSGANHEEIQWQPRKYASLRGTSFKGVPIDLTLEAGRERGREVGRGAFCNYTNMETCVQPNGHLETQVSPSIRSPEVRRARVVYHLDRAVRPPLEGEFPHWQMGSECLFTNIFPLITNYTRERGFVARVLEMWNLISRDLQ